MADLISILGVGRKPRQVNEILAVPRFKRAALLQSTVPTIDSNRFTNWLRRGELDLERQVVLGESRELTAVSGALERNESLGEHQRYTGGDILKVMVLHAFSQSGLSFTLSGDVINVVLRRAQGLLLRPQLDGLVRFSLEIFANQDGDHRISPVVENIGKRIEHRELRKIQSALEHVCSPPSVTRAEREQLEPDWYATIEVDTMIGRFLQHVLPTREA